MYGTFAHAAAVPGGGYVIEDENGISATPKEPVLAPISAVTCSLDHRGAWGYVRYDQAPAAGPVLEQETEAGWDGFPVLGVVCIAGVLNCLRAARGAGHAHTFDARLIAETVEARCGPAVDGRK